MANFPTDKISFLVMKKNCIPDNAISLLTISSVKRVNSFVYDCLGTSRITSIGFFDSSVILAV